MGCETPTSASTMASNGRSTKFSDSAAINEPQIAGDVTTSAFIIEGTSSEVWGSLGLEGSSGLESSKASACWSAN
jgi:hypothetical protein